MDSVEWLSKISWILSNAHIAHADDHCGLGWTVALNDSAICHIAQDIIAQRLSPDTGSLQTWSLIRRDQSCNSRCHERVCDIHLVNYAGEVGHEAISWCHADSSTRIQRVKDIQNRGVKCVI